MSGATTATRMNATTTASPSTALRRCRNRRQARPAGLSSAPNSSTAIVAIAMGHLARRCWSPSSQFPEPWIDEDVSDVGEQIEEDVGRRRNQRHALHHRIIAVEDAVDDQLPEAG